MNFQNNFCGVGGGQLNPNQWTPDTLNQWSNNQELVYQNIPHDKVDWRSLANEWINMQNAIIPNLNLNHHLMNDFNLQSSLQQPTFHHPNFLQRPIHINNFNLPIQPNHHFNNRLNLQNQFHYFQSSQPPPPPPLNHHLPTLNAPFNQATQFNQANLNLQPPLINAPPQTNYTRMEPPLLPYTIDTPSINQINNNQLNNNSVNLNNNNVNINNNNQFNKKNDIEQKQNKTDFKSDLNDIKANKKVDIDKNGKLFNQKASNHHLKFIQSSNNHNKVNHLIPNQLENQESTIDESQLNGSIDSNKRKSLPLWIQEGLEKMEKEKQKKIQIEEDLKKKAKEDQLRKELDNEDKEDELSIGQIKQSEKKKIFSTSNVHNQKTFADRFLVQKVKDYYYENEKEREKELTLRTRKVLTNILIEVTDSLIRQVASKCIQEARIQKIAAISKLAKQEPIKSSGLVGIVSQYNSDSEEEDNSSKTNDKDSKKKSDKSKSNSDQSRKHDPRKNDKLKDEKHRNRSRSNEKRKRSISRDRNRNSRRTSQSKEKNKRSQSKERNKRSRSKDKDYKGNSRSDNSKEIRRSRSRERNYKDSKSDLSYKSRSSFSSSSKKRSRSRERSSNYRTHSRRRRSSSVKRNRSNSRKRSAHKFVN